jgi:hypothetical protein
MVANERRMAMQPHYYCKEGRLRWVVASIGNIVVDIGMRLTEV